MNNTTTDLATLLHQRAPVLVRIVENSTDPATLTEEMPVSRATVDRTVAAFEEWGLIAPHVDRVVPTLFARLVSTVYDDFMADIATMAAHETDEVPLWRTAGERTDVVGLVADRLDLLEYAQTPRDKRTLVAELPYARSTVDWAVRELESAGLIQRTVAGYTTTPVGQRIAPRYRTLLATLADLLAAQDLLGHLPPDCEFPPALLTEADIERADETTPYRLLSGLRDRLDTADQVRLLLPSLPTPQLLDICHHRVVRHGTALEVVTDPSLAETLTTDFPGPLAEMTAAAAGGITTYVADTPPFGVLLTGTATTSTVSILVYEQQAIYGAIHTETEAALRWAEDYYEHIRDEATETTTDLREASAAASTAPVALAGVSDSAQVEREAEGFVQLTPEYFAHRAPAPPTTAWRAGFDLVDVHAGYAIDREIDSDSDSTRQPLTDALIMRLDTGVDHALLGPPGSGKSTVCQAVACQWYEQGRGSVFYRESGKGGTFDSPAILSAQLRADEGQTLVVVEDAVRAEANTIFRVMEDFRDDVTVTFLIDARTSEWDDPPAFPADARLGAYRTEIVETVAMPGLDGCDCERLVEEYQETTGHTIDVPTAHLLQRDETEPDDATTPEHVQMSQPAKLLSVIHRLILHTEPLAGENARTPTTLTEDVQQTYADLRSESELALDVGVLVNLLNAAGLGVQPALVYALANDNDEVKTVRAALSLLDGHIIFTRTDNTGTAAYRTVNEVWSQLFLDHLLETADTDRAASERFGRCLSALFILADEKTRRERSMAAVGGDARIIDRIATTPCEWVDATIEQVFQFGRFRPKLAPLFGTTEYPTIELPTACSPTIAPRCARWRGEMYFEGGYPDRAHRELDHTLSLVETTEASDTATLRAVKATSYFFLGSLAFERGNLDAATEFYTQGRDSYRTIDDQVGEADCHNGLGAVAAVQGDYERAAGYYEQCLAIYREAGASRKKRGTILNNLGDVAMHRGDIDRAEDYLEQSIEIGRDFEKRCSLAHAFCNLGDIARLRGDLDRAEDYRKQQLAIARDTGVSLLTAFGLLGRGRITLDRGDLARAAEYIQQGLDISCETESLRTKALGYRYLGILKRKDDDFGTAETHFTDALRLAREGGNRYAEGKILDELGKLAETRDDQERAREHFTAAVEIYRELGAVRDIVNSLEQVAETCEALDDCDAAFAHYETAITTAEEAAFDVPHKSISEQRTRLAADAPGDGGD